MAPRRFTEKIQWRKLFDMNPVYAILCDKLAVRSYIAARIGEQFLVPLRFPHSGLDQAGLVLHAVRRPPVLPAQKARQHDRARRAAGARPGSCPGGLLRLRGANIRRRNDAVFVVGARAVHSRSSRLLLGGYWRIENPLRRAIGAVLFGRREIVPPAR
jgi:hypothetical protein